MTFEPWDVVVVPFPFTDKKSSKRRPALVLSAKQHFNTGHSVLAMITSRDNAGWPLDVPIADGGAAGLWAPSVVRMKLFTLDDRLILRKAGSLSGKDVKAVAATLKKLFPKTP
ncbi:MAG: type II toxin-antitoxin system PemK/MazF family toxin [Gammaproteobacteria bacterium]